MLSLKHASVRRLNAFDAYLQRQIIGLSNTKHTEQILMIKSTGWIEEVSFAARESDVRDEWRRRIIM